MSRRLKRKIRDLCQLDQLSKEERRAAATSLLHDNDAKQKLCNSVPGLSFKDIDRAMKDILSERQPTEEELERIAVPEKYDPPFLPGSKSGIKKMKYRTLTLEEVQALIAASEAPFTPETESEKPNRQYPTWTLEETLALIDGTYDPNNFQKGILKRKR